MQPLLTINCITYNHAPFIRQTLDSFLMQKTNFPFIVVVGDDCSTDGTTEIIKEYAEKYPDIIKPIFHEHNVGAEQNVFDVHNACKTKYVALCEGDDYWTDENKLQKQVDFLESNPNFSICFHKVKVAWEDKSKENSYFPSREHRFNKDVLLLEHLLERNFIQTNTAVYRWRFVDENIENIFPRKILPMDWFLHLLHAEKGKIKYLEDCMAVYRRHSGGIWMGAGVSDEWFLKCAVPHVRCYKGIQDYFHKDYSSQISDMLFKTVVVCLKNKKFSQLEDILEEFPEEYNEIINSLAGNNQALTIVEKKQRQYKRYKKFFNIFLIISIVLFILFFVETYLLLGGIR